jgi:hypothetical protein
VKLPIDDRRDRRSASTAASPEEAAAVVAALERFMRATAAPLTASASSALAPEGWRRAAALEGISREPQGDAHDPWLTTPG